MREKPDFVRKQMCSWQIRKQVRTGERQAGAWGGGKPCAPVSHPPRGRVLVTEGNEESRRPYLTSLHPCQMSLDVSRRRSLCSAGSHCPPCWYRMSHPARHPRLSFPGSGALQSFHSMRQFLIGPLPLSCGERATATVPTDGQSLQKLSGAGTCPESLTGASLGPRPCDPVSPPTICGV